MLVQNIRWWVRGADSILRRENTRNARRAAVAAAAPTALTVKLKTLKNENQWKSFTKKKQSQTKPTDWERQELKKNKSSSTINSNMIILKKRHEIEYTAQFFSLCGNFTVFYFSPLSRDSFSLIDFNIWSLFKHFMRKAAHLVVIAIFTMNNVAERFGVYFFSNSNSDSNSNFNTQHSIALTTNTREKNHCRV